MRSSMKGVAPEWYTLTGEDGEDEPVQFYLVPLNGLTWSTVLMDSYNAETGEVSGAGIVKAFKLGVKGWRNIEDADKPGSALLFSQQNMPKIPPTWIMDVGNRVLAISRITVEQEKNSDLPLS